MFKFPKTKLWLAMFGLLLSLGFASSYVIPVHAQPNLTITGAITSDCRELAPGKCKIIDYLATFIRVLSAMVGVVIVIMITVGGIQYSTARDNPQATQAARMRIYNAVFALILYLFTFALLQWLVPGGIV